MIYYYENDPIAELVVHMAVHGPRDKLLAALTDPRGHLDEGFPALFSRNGNHPQWITTELALEALKARPELAGAATRKGITALHVAAEGRLANSTTIVATLLAAGANPLFENDDNRNAIELACMANDGTGRNAAKIQQTWPGLEATLNHLLDRMEHELGKDEQQINIVLEEALRVACAEGKLRTVGYLIERGAPVALDLVLEYGEDPATPLELAAEISEHDLDDKQHDKLLRLLLTAIPEDRLETHLANRDGGVMDVDVRGPLRAAANQGRTNALKVLVQAGAVDAPSEERGVTALMDASWASHDDTITFLLKGDPTLGLAGPSAKYVNAKDEDGQTALHYTFLEETGFEEEQLAPIVKDLLEAGADPRIKNDKGETPIDLARERGDMTLVQKMEEVAEQLGPLKRKSSKARLDPAAFGAATGGTDTADQTNAKKPVKP